MSALTDDQLLAATSPAQALYLEAGPGSGKTTVAAHRFGIQRYRRGEASDPRGVIAVSFTRAATRELRRRVARLWGPSAVRLPHRILTLDALIWDLVQLLLAEGCVHWPGGHTTLDVRDSWKTVVDTNYQKQDVRLIVRRGQVSVQPVTLQTRATRPLIRQVRTKIEEGICTHDEVRAVLEHALEQAAMRAAMIAHLSAAVRALIVDEVFDANEVDLAVVQLAIDAGVDVTLVGDPWQALYRFRGARPDLVPGFVSHNQMTVRPLLQSFRWCTQHQADLASRLRQGHALVLAPPNPGEVPDVVLATEWKHLWELDDRILPLAFGSAKGTSEEAAATLLLDYLTRTLHGLPAVYIAEALSTLRIDDPLALYRLDSSWPQIIDQLLTPGAQGPKAAYVATVELLGNETESPFRAVRANHTNRFNLLRERLQIVGDLTLGMTVHQAKGREWDTVGIALQDSHRAQLAAGLSVSEPTHRQLYVACTRARLRTVALTS